ncbi:MAG: dihydrofolate reductase family protein [Saprospiraceae bacterium]
MRKVIAGINMTLDGFCDHTAIVADDQLHQHYTELISGGGTILYGRTTYQLMESYWPLVIKNPTGNKADNEFAVAIDRIPKIVFSRTLKHLEWENASLAKGDLKEEIVALKQSANGEDKDILIGSPSLIVAALNLNLVDEFQICIHPVILGNGLSLLKNINARINLKLLNIKTFGSGAVIHYYGIG